ncbi:MAG: hypothetical protein KDA32_11315 [Phycisphaerales bacterium]|nr:hypothetical protein [Phycisphaerales bacterium]
MKFERRLRWLTLMLAALAIVIVGRLVDIQVLRAAQFEALEDRLLTRPVRYLRAPRGAILDRNGTPLVSDEPMFDISVHYPAIRALAEGEISPETQVYLRATAREMIRLGQAPGDMGVSDLAAQLSGDLDEMWEWMAGLAKTPRAELVDRAAAYERKFDRIQEAVARNTDNPSVRIRETELCHPMLDAVDAATAMRAREQSRRFPWLRVSPASKRVFHDADTVAQLLGVTGSASRERIEADPISGDEFHGLRSGDIVGVSGVERMAELLLRGERGRVTEEFDRSEIERVDPVPGNDVRLTIDMRLQNAAYEILGRHVEKSEHPSGGAAVVLDVDTREVLAMVSYPSYPANDYRALYTDLARDTLWLPTRFRPVQDAQPPGSTCKLISVYAALTEGVMTPSTAVNCSGRFREDQPNAFRCWIFNQYGLSHGLQTAEDAIRNSCNIYFYTAGDRLGVDRLTSWFDRFGLGRTQGTGLIEETGGVDPTSLWLATHRRDARVYPSDAWNFSIGQGEVNATPLQVANVAATIASGRWRPVRLLLDADRAPLREDIPDGPQLNESILHVVRKGMWRVVNERGGTANVAKLDSSSHVLCGKTGSAQVTPRILTRRYVFEWPDKRRQEVIARSEPEAREQLPESAGKPRLAGSFAADRFPPWQPGDKLPSHAWFIGFMQPAGTPQGTVPRGAIAISVLVDYGGSGGRVAGPAAREIAEWIIADEAAHRPAVGD